MELEFERFYRLSMGCLRLNGAHPFIAKNWKWALQFCLMYGYYTLYTIFFAINMIFCDTQNNDIANGCINGILVMVYITVTFHYGVMMRYKEHIKTIIKIQQNNFVAARVMPVEDQEIVKHYASKGRRSSTFWFGSTCLILFIYPVKAIIQSFQQYYWNREFKLYPMDHNMYPFGIEDVKLRLDVFIFLYFLRLLHGTFNIVTYTAFTPLGPIFILNTCGQVELVIKQASNLFTENELDREATNKAIKKIIQDLHQIYSDRCKITDLQRCICNAVFQGNIKIINKIFEVFYEMNLKATVIATPVALILVTWVWKHTGVWGMNYILYFLGPLILCFEICYYCDILMEKAEELRRALYACGWEKQFDGKLRKTLIIMLTRTMRPMAIKTPFRTLCLDTFSQMCFQSYSIFNVINAAIK